MVTDTSARNCTRCCARLASDNHEQLCRPCQRAAQAGESSPPEVPPGFWDDEGIRDALIRERHIGHAVRSYRSHPYHGRRPIPQELVARWLNISQTQLGRIERGRPITDLDRLAQWARTLRIPAELLWFRLPADEPDEGREVERRKFLATTVLLPKISRSALPAKTTITRFPDFVPDSDLRDIARDMATLRAVLTRQDNVLGAAAVAPTVTHQLSVMRKIGAKSKGEARGMIMRLQAAYAEFGSWLADELGDRNAGQFWIDRALEWSHETGDGLIVGYILARKAQRAIDEGDPSGAVSLARAAQRFDITDRVRAAALQYEAIGHASMAEAAEFREAIDRAHILTDSLSPAGEGDWAVWCTPEYVMIHEANGWVRLGEPMRAVAAYERALSGWPSYFLRDEGVYYGRLARAHALARNPDGAVHAARKALDIAARTGSARIVAELAPLPDVLSEWKDSAPVRIFNAELLSALAVHADPEHAEAD
jgi:transcriptional regulator with XRE-family HTH domain